MYNKTLVVNLFGGPGCGKSTGAAYIFSQLKMKGYDVEIVTEFAKDKTWENNTLALRDQAYIFGEQAYRINRCYKKVEIIITDSPLLLSIIYNRNYPQSFNQFVADVFNNYYNVNYFLTREKKYNSNGRLQTEEEAKIKDKEILNLLNDEKVQYSIVESNVFGYNKVVSDVINIVKNVTMSSESI